jgi:hypothetical protein
MWKKLKNLLKRKPKQSKLTEDAIRRFKKEERPKMREQGN